jgi:hypothetical protein
MTISITVHPPFWRLLRVVTLTAVVVLALGVAARLLTKPSDQPSEPPVADSGSKSPATQALVSASGPLLLPVVNLCLENQTQEANWISAFALAVGGVREQAVSHGRADVLTAEFAFELDWFDKWHEGLGQALHYADATSKRPALALIVGASSWPLDTQALSKLAEIDRVSAKQGIKLILLRPQC